MKLSPSRTAAATVAAAVAAAVGLALTGPAATADGSAGNPATWPGVAAGKKAPGLTVPNVLSPVLAAHSVAQGSMPLDGGIADIPFYGYFGNGPLLPAPNSNVEATKSEPDKNTYLVLKNQNGPDAAYHYGSHFLFQGHEAGPRGYLTRVNLDADAAHRVTLMASTFTDGAPLPLWDGSTWDPFVQRVLLSSEFGPRTGVSQATPAWPSQVVELPAFGRGGFEGIQNDKDGNVWLAEDIGGTTVPTSSRNPNSFIYRFLPTDPADLTKGGRLQALQVTSRATGGPIRFVPVDATHPTGATFSQDYQDLHTYGLTFATRWVTVHDSATDPNQFDPNAAAKAAGATPFKRPENGVFRPGSDFSEFFFTETGDTNANATANNGFGGFGAVFRISQSGPSASTGTLSLVFRGDLAHTGLDNLTFLSERYLAVVEDAGDTLHAQRGALDSAYVVDTRADYGKGEVPNRFIGEGRDPSATIDSALLGSPGFVNDGDNEITGIHVSNGDASVNGVLGARTPDLFNDGWRLFWTQQHGDNTTFEVVPADRDR